MSRFVHVLYFRNSRNVRNRSTIVRNESRA
jgi:hypothetical protein